MFLILIMRIFSLYIAVEKKIEFLKSMMTSISLLKVSELIMKSTSHYHQGDSQMTPLKNMHTIKDSSTFRKDFEMMPTKLI